MGATKIVLYDDSSTDALAETVEPFGDAVDVIRLVNGINGVPGDWGRYRGAGRQDWAYAHCTKHYTSKSMSGWLGIWDVDEFVYPCRRPKSAQQWGGNILWDTWKNATQAGADGHTMRCTIFGVNLQDKPQPPGQLVLTNNIRRAPDPESDGSIARTAWDAMAESCKKCGDCCRVHDTKTMYNISSAHRLIFGAHVPHTKTAVLDHSWGKPYGGLCCNHYQYKSTEEVKNKAVANLDAHYTIVGGSEHAKKHLTMMPDHLIWQYLPDMVQLLQDKGFKYEIPPMK